MELIKGAPVSAKIKEEVGAMLEKINGPAPKLAIVRVGENPDDAPSVIHFLLILQMKISKKNLLRSTQIQM